MKITRASNPNELQKETRKRKNETKKIMSLNEVLFQPNVIDEILMVAAFSSPIKCWPNYALVCRSWRESSKRVFPFVRNIVMIPIKFDKNHTMETIKTKDEEIGNRKKVAKVIKKHSQNYAWAFSCGVSLGLKKVHHSSVTHSIRIGGGVLIGVFISEGPPPPKEKLTFNWTRFPFADQHPGYPFFIAFFGTYSGDFYIYSDGPMEQIRLKTLDSPQGSVFHLTFDAYKDEFTVECPKIEFKNSVKVFGNKKPKESEMSKMQLRWVCSVFPPKDTVTFESMMREKKKQTRFNSIQKNNKNEK